MANMLKAALEYLERGWCVLPVAPGGKHPCVKWVEYQTRLPTKAEVRDWWTKWPDNGISLVTGKISGVVVVDIDERAGGDLEGHLPTGLIAATPGGTHLFYRYPGEPITNATNVPSPGGTPADIRGDGGVIILAPTMNNSGALYTWADKGHPALAPRWVLEHSRTRSEFVDGPRDRRPNWIEDAIAGRVEEGTRNQTAASLTGYYCKLGMHPDIVLAEMLRWNDGLTDPLFQRELRTTVESVCRTASSRQAVRDQAQRTKPADPKAPTSFELKPYGTYMKEHAEWETRWLFDGWLPDQTIAMMVAAPGSFKTWLEFDMAVSLAGGFPFLGNEPGRTGPVIMIQQEDSPGDIVDRISTMHFAKAGIAKPRMLKDGTVVVEFPNDIPIFFHEAARLRFDDPTVMEQLRKQIETIKPVAVFIDPLYSAASAEGFMADSVQKMIPLKQWRTDYKTSFVLAHHTNKSGTTTRTRQRVWGSQLLNGFLEMGLQVHRPDENAEWIVVERHTKSASALATVRVDYDINTGDEWRYKPTVTNLTPKEAKALLDGDDDSPKTGRTSTIGGLSKPARALLSRIESEPATLIELTSKMSMTAGAIQGALAELERGSHIVQAGDKYATIIDATGLSR